MSGPDIAYWFDSPFRLICEQATLGTFGATVAADNGESRRVVEIGDGNWLLKEYRSVRSPADAVRLDRLVTLPRDLRAAELATLAHDTAWPVARVVQNGATVGVVMPRAPERYEAILTPVSGKPQKRALTLDWLARRQDEQSRVGLAPQGLAERLRVCSRIAAVAALMEAHGVAYLDWSYANAFWSPRDHSVYVIDIDSCSHGPRPQLETLYWEDPLFPRSEPAGSPTDRYRVAVLTARCVTGERDVGSAMAALGADPLLQPVAAAIGRTVNAARSQDRQPLGELSHLLTHVADICTGTKAATEDGVVAWRQVGRSRPRTDMPP